MFVITDCIFINILISLYTNICVYKHTHTYIYLCMYYQYFYHTISSCSCWNESLINATRADCFMICYSTHRGRVTHMRQWTRPSVVQIMACCLLGAIIWTNDDSLWIGLLWIQWNFNQNTKILIQENEFENVACKIAAILSRSLYVNSDHDIHRNLL